MKKITMIIISFLLIFIMNVNIVYGMNVQNQTKYPSPIIISGVHPHYLGKTVNVFDLNFNTLDSIQYSQSIYTQDWLDSLTFERIESYEIKQTEYFGYSDANYQNRFYNEINLPKFVDKTQTLFMNHQLSLINLYQKLGKEDNGFFYNSGVTIQTDKIYVNNLDTQLENIELIPEFINELFMLDQVPQTEYIHYAKYILLSYGTHVALGASFGGSYNISISLQDDATDFEKLLINTNFYQIPDYLNDTIELVHPKLTKVLSSVPFPSYFSSDIRTIGGKHLNFINLNAVNSDVNNWKSTFTEDSYKNMIGYELTPIWDLLPSKIEVPNYGVVKLDYIKTIFEKAYLELSLTYTSN
ncbi:MAC/perforin domain-containing protein [Acholeplasma hippikon]|uniref:MAC/Perforin domain n=1 Tax=Acholeplasma hippikon TaxID=264636 RepID=A0A449BJQ5_9MOLU|nr:MAC/perforin domain-containing protein [Acholeplasma hippikon]VEU82682.1 MAC/Perforin domain [Acholeplasma hippikon]